MMTGDPICPRCGTYWFPSHEVYCLRLVVETSHDFLDAMRPEQDPGDEDEHPEGQIKSACICNECCWLRAQQNREWADAERKEPKP